MGQQISGKNNQYMRVDVVGDNYESPHLLKNGVRVDRGSGTTVTFELESILPSNFKTDFFFCSDNKARLYRMMAGYFATLARDSATGTQYFITQGSSEVSGALPDSTHLGSSQSSKVTCHHSIQSCFVIRAEEEVSFEI